MTATVVDARGMRCPWPALRAAKAMRESTAVLLLADDPAASAEIGALAAAHEWEIIRNGDEFHLKWMVRRAIG